MTTIGKKFSRTLFLTTILSSLTFYSAYAANQDDNTDNGSTTAVTAGNSISFTAPAAGVDEIFNVADNDAVGDTGVVVLATTANGVGTLQFDGTSTATGTIGATGNRIGLITGGIATETVTFTTGAIFAGDINFTGTGAMSFDTDVTVTNDIDFNNNAGTLTLADDVTVTGAVDNTGGAGGAITFSGTGNITGTVGSTNAVGVITGGANGEVVTLSSTVAASDITFSGTGGVTLGGNTTITNDVDFNNNAGTLTLSDNVTLTGVVDNTGGTGGAITFSGTGGITGAVGGTNAVGLVTAGAAGETVTFSSALTAADIDFSGTGTVSLGGTTTITNDIDFNNNAGTISVGSGVTVNSAIDNTGGVGGNITFAGSGTVAGGAIGATNAVGTVTLSGSSTTVNTAAITATTYALSGNLLASSGVITAGSGSTITSTINSTSSYGKMTGGGNASVNANTTLTITIDSNAGYIANGTTFTIIDGAGGAGVADLTTTITDNSSLISFTQVTSNDADLIITANRSATYNTVSTTSNSSAAGTALEAAGSTASGDMLTVITALETLPSTTAVANAVSQTTPESNGAVVAASVGAQGQTFNAVSARLGSVRTAMSGKGNGSGMAAGAKAANSNIWGKGFASTADQDARNNVEGYESDTYGGAVGLDTTFMNDRLTVGIAYSYAETDVDTKGTRTGNGTEVASHQGTIYGGYDFGDYYVDGMASVAFNEYDSERQINFGTIRRTAIADYDGNQYSAKLGGGYNFNYQGFILTPTASLQYTHLDLSHYSERGAGSLNLEVQSQDYDVLQSGIGGKVSYVFDTNIVSIIPEVRAEWLHDFIGDEQQTTSRFTGGGGSFVTQAAKAQKDSGVFGASLVLESIYNVDLVADYDFEIKDEYRSHSGNLALKYKF